MERLAPDWRRWWPTALMVLSLGLAVWGQLYLPKRDYPLDGPVYYVLAVALFLWAVAQGREAVVPGPAAVPVIVKPLRTLAGAGRQLSLAMAAAAFSGLAYLSLGGNRFTVTGTLFWGAAFATFVAAFWEVPADWRQRLRDWLRPRPLTVRVSWTLVALLLIIALATFFRFYRLDSVPAEMTSDHAEKLLDVKDVLDGQYRIFFPRNTGREAFQFYLTAFLIRWLGLPISHLALKVGTALFGLFAIPFIYLLGRELYNREVGLLAATLAAVSHWHVAIVRVGLRFPFTPAFLAPTMYFFVRALRYNRRNDWLLAGFFLGVGLHTYSPFRVAALLLAIMVGIELVFDLGERTLRAWRSRQGSVVEAYALGTSNANSLTPSFWVNGLLSAAMAFIVFIPLFRYMRDDPQMFWFRTLTRSTGLERPLPGDALRIFLGNVRNGLLMFNVRGDPVWVNTVPFAPVLDYITGALFVLGMAYVVWRLLRHGDRASAHLLAGLFVMMLPSTLSLAFPNENPSVVRAGGAVPIVMIIAALPLALALRRLVDVFGRVGLTVAVLLLAVLVVQLARINYQWYFVDYDEQYRQSAWNSSEMGAVVRAFAGSVGDMGHVWHIAYPYWVDTRNIAINAGDITWNQAILDVEQVRTHVADSNNKLYILHPEDQHAIQVLREVFPNGQLRRHSSRTPGKDFMSYFAPGEGSIPVTLR